MGSPSKETLQRLGVCTVARPCWEAGGLDEHGLSASLPMSLVPRTENDHRVPFDCH